MTLTFDPLPSWERGLCFGRLCEASFDKDKERLGGGRQALNHQI
jgi:hypothetical protein